jgi:hypothetical protein
VSTAAAAEGFPYASGYDEELSIPLLKGETAENLNGWFFGIFAMLSNNLVELLDISTAIQDNGLTISTAMSG